MSKSTIGLTLVTASILTACGGADTAQVSLEVPTTPPKIISTINPSAVPKMEKVGISSNKELSKQPSRSEARLLGKQLIFMIYEGKFDEAHALLDHGASIDVRGPDNVTALHLACYKGNDKLIKRLVAMEADVNARRDDGNTPMMYVAAEGTPEQLDSLIKAGAKNHVMNREGHTPLIIAALAKNKDNVRALSKLSSSQEDKTAALYHAAMLNAPEIVKILKDAGADPNLAVGGITPLAAAKKDNNPKAIEILKNVGATE